MISKFCPAGHSILIFMKRILPLPKPFELCKGYVISQTNAIPQFILSKRWIGGGGGEGGDSFLNDIGGRHVHIEGKKIHGLGRGGGLLWMIP